MNQDNKETSLRLLDKSIELAKSLLESREVAVKSTRIELKRLEDVKVLISKEKTEIC